LIGTKDSFFNNDALLILDDDRKIKDCNKEFLCLFGFDALPVGASFDAFFNMANGAWHKLACWQPFVCEQRESRKKVHGMMFCEKNRIRMVFSVLTNDESFYEGMPDAQFSSLFSQMKEGVAVHSLHFQNGKAADYVIEHFNESFAELFGIDPHMAAGQKASCFFNTKKAPFLKKFEKAVEATKPTRFDTFYGGSGRHYLISVTPFSKNRFATVVSDLSESRHSQLLYKALNKAAAVISSSSETDNVFESAAQILREYNFECMLMPIEDGAAVNKTYLSFGGIKTIQYPEQIPAVDAFYSKVMRDRRAVYVESLDLPLSLLPQGVRGHTNCIASPLVIDNILAGLFVIMSCGLKQRDTEAVTAFTNQLAAILEKAALISSLKKHIKELERSKQEYANVAERLNMASQASRVGIWDIDLIRNAEYMDNALQKIYGLEPGEFDGKISSWKKFVHPDDQERVARASREAICKGRDYSVEYRIVLHDGTLRYISSMGIVYQDDAGRPVRMVGTDWDITERKKTELALLAEKELLKTTLQSIGDGVMVTDSEGRITLANAQFSRICGTALGDIQGSTLGKVLKGIYRLDGGLCRLPEKTLLTGRTMKGTDCVLVRNDGKTVPVAYTVTPIRDNEAAICGAVLVMRSIEEEKKKQKKIDYLVHHDPLTGVYNRRYFELMVKKLDKKANLPLSVLSCDVNGLKLANDAFGHSAGDRLLKRMASIMTRISRPGDVVARVGGDEFFILMPNADKEQAALFCDKIKTLAAKKRTGPIEDSLSVGFGTKMQPEESIHTVINMAESDMYRNKTNESPKMRDKSIKGILSTLYERFHDLPNNVNRVGHLCCGLARQLGLGEREIADIRLLAMMHEIGNISVDQNILKKPGKLDQEEWKQVKRHPEVGFRILLAFNETAHLAGSVLSHHERYDGHGYPNGVCGEQIPLISQIVAVAGAYDAMTNDRPYRKAFSHEMALEEIEKNKGAQFDPVIAEEFLRMMGKKVV